MSKRYTVEELAEILRKHVAWLRGEPEGVRAILSGTNLSNADLSEANLSEAELNEADLSGADLSLADLSGAYLSRANLRGADLRGANLSGADTRGADLYVNSACGILGVDIYVAQLGKNRLVYRGDTGEIMIGCQQHSIDSWLEEGVNIGMSAGWSMPDIDLYMSVISAIRKRRKIK